MSSDTEIANRALTKLGDQRILSLGDDTNAGRTMNSLYTQVRDAELARHHWKFGIKRTSLVALAAPPAWGFAYQFPLPPDYLGIVQVNDYYLRPMTKAKAPWSVERAGDDSGLVLVTDLQAPLKIRYNSRVSNAGLLHPLFVDLFAAKLAYEACEAITQSSAKKKDCQDDYQYALTEAARVDAIELPPDELPWGSWLDSRNGPNSGSLSGDSTIWPSGFEIR